MPYHEWGDSWEHWDTLSMAESYINKMYYKITKKQPFTKEKYGTIRYEHTSLWLKNENDLSVLLKILIKACNKFPEVKEEIVEDLLFILDAECQISEMIGMLKGVSYE